MESGEGFCYTQVLLAVTKLEEANAEFFKMTEEEFNKYFSIKGDK